MCGLASTELLAGYRQRDRLRRHAFAQAAKPSLPRPESCCRNAVVRTQLGCRQGRFRHAFYDSAPQKACMRARRPISKLRSARPQGVVRFRALILGRGAGNEIVPPTSPSPTGPHLSREIRHECNICIFLAESNGEIRPHTRSANRSSGSRRAGNRSRQGGKK